MADDKKEDPVLRYAKAPGKTWRFRAADEDGIFEEKDLFTFDELAVDHWMHLERMDTHFWSMRLGDARIDIRIDEHGKVTVNIDRGEYGEATGYTKVPDER